MKRITLITGGGKSGKSRYALELANAYSKKGFIATAVPFDQEMQVRIRRHKKERDASYVTIEEPLHLSSALRSLPPNIEVALIDCLTVWLGNVMHQFRRDAEETSQELTSLIEAIGNSPCDLIIVTNEVSMGIVPTNALAREFRDLAGQVNQSLARLADQVILMVCGLPVIVKGKSQ